MFKGFAFSFHKWYWLEAASVDLRKAAPNSLMYPDMHHTLPSVRGLPLLF